MLIVFQYRTQQAGTGWCGNPVSKRLRLTHYSTTGRVLQYDDELIPTDPQDTCCCNELT